MLPRRLIALAALLAPITLTGCCDIRIPAGTLGQMLNPEWAKDRVTATVCYRFPKCTFANPQEEQEFKDLVGQINEVGRALRPALKSGEITAEEFVIYEVILELYAAELLAWCEGSSPTMTEPAKTLVQTYAERAGLRGQVDAVMAAPRPGRLGAISKGLQGVRSKAVSRGR